MFGIIAPLKSIFNNFTLALIILVALFSLLIDGPNYNNEGFRREYRFIRILSYLYISLGIILFILVQII